MPIYARDLMNTSLLTVDPNAPLLQAHRLFLEEEINGAPVIDEDGKVCGVLSSLDLLRAVDDEYEGQPGAVEPFYFRSELPYSGPDWIHDVDDFQDRLGSLTVADAMVTVLVCVGLDATVEEIAHTMRNQHVHRVLVMEGKILRGIISTFDLLQLFEQPETFREESASI